MSEQSRDVSASTPSLAQVQERVEAVERLAHQIAEARSMGKKLRLTFVIVVLVVLFCFGMALYMMFSRLTGPEMEGTLQKEMVQLSMDVQPMLQRTLMRVAPDYQKAFEAKAQEIFPKLSKQLEPEIDLFISNMQKEATKQVEEGLAAIAKKQEATLKETFPDLKDPDKVDKVINNLRRAVSAGTGEVLVSRLNKATDELGAVYNRLVKFLPKEKKEAHRKLSERFAETWKAFVDWEKVIPMMKEEKPK